MDKEVKEKKVCRQQIIFCILAVLYVFVSLLFSLPVHAATVTPKGSLILESSSGDYLSTAYTNYVRIYSEDSPPVKFASLVRYDDIDKGDSATLDFIIYTTDIDASFTYYSGNETQYTDTSKSPYTSYMEISSSGMTVYTLSDGTKVRASSGGLGRKCYTITPYVPMYNGAPGYKSLTGKEYIQAFLEHLLVTGDLKPVNGTIFDNPDFQDTAYAFTGFTANNKMTATWTGTTERSYLKDEDVEEYVRVSYGFAAKDAPDSIKQVDNDSTEYSTAAKSLTVKVSDLKPDDDSWFLRYIQITPCYRQAGLGAWGDFYHGIPNVIYFNKDGSIEKIIQKTKPTDLNKGNMVYDSSIGYLQNVIYTEKKTHDGTGRQATFKWSTQKSLPSDAQVEIVAQNFYIEWFNKKTEENFIFKEYGEDCFYSAGSYSFNANTPVWTWLKEKDIDPFSFKTQSYGSTEYYLRIVTYNASDALYHYGGWVKVDIKSKDTTNLPTTDVETGGFDDSTGLWNQDTESDDSYHYSTDDEGKLTGNIDVNSWEDLNINSFTWMYRNMQSMVSSLGDFPVMVNTVFGYLPVQYITALGVLLVAIVLMRFLGR